MSKTKEELNALKEEVETVNEKCRELTEEELEQVTGGLSRRDFESDSGHAGLARGDIALPA